MVLNGFQGSMGLREVFPAVVTSRPQQPSGPFGNGLLRIQSTLDLRCLLPNSSSVYVCVFIYMCAQKAINIYIYMYIYIYIYIHKHVHRIKSIETCRGVCVHTLIYTYRHTTT